MNKSEQLIACLEGEIAKRDEELAACRVAVENCELFRARIAELEAKTRTAMGVGSGSGNLFVYGDYDSIKAAQKIVIERDQLSAELAAIKAHGNYAPASVVWIDAHHVIEGNNPSFIKDVALVSAERTSETQIPLASLTAAPVQQAEYGDAYQGAREDLAIWKRRALEAEEKVLQQEQIIDHLTSEAQGESRFGEPVVTPDAPCVPDGYVLADKKALGTVLQALVNAPHHIRELQVTRQPVELFSDNPINVLIANYEAPAAPVQQPKCRTCDDNGLIGGPSFYSPDEGGDPCPDCCAPVQQVSVPDGSTKMQWPEIVALVNEVLGCEAHKYPCERGSIGHEMTGINFNSLARIIDRVHRLASATAAPAADAGLVEAFTTATNRLDRIALELTGHWANEATDVIAVSRAALAAHSAKGVV